MDDIEKWLQIGLNACNLFMNLFNRFCPRQSDCKPEQPAPQPRKKTHLGKGRKKKR